LAARFWPWLSGKIPSKIASCSRLSERAAQLLAAGVAEVDVAGAVGVRPAEQHRPAHIRQSRLHIRQSAPYVRQSRPHIRESRPHVRQSRLHIRQSAPYVRESRPRIRESRPHVRQSRPNIRQSKPHVRQSRPDGTGAVGVRPAEEHRPALGHLTVASLGGMP